MTDQRTQVFALVERLNRQRAGVEGLPGRPFNGFLYLNEAEVDTLITLLSDFTRGRAAQEREAFHQGWSRGFQEALQPDLYPERNREQDAWDDWKAEP